MATLAALVLALIEGRTDLPLSGVFGAGKTRSAAILVVGLLVFEPNLKLMILAKENVAAQAFAEHIVSFGLSESVMAKIGRLVGHMELQKNKTNKTPLDVTSENRHDVLRNKKLLIGCGRGFQQECTQLYSPVAAWVKEVGLTLTDESQQNGNIEETSVVARTPRTCLKVWAGDDRQTPGGLKKTDEARPDKSSCSAPSHSDAEHVIYSRMNCTLLLRGSMDRLSRHLTLFAFSCQMMQCPWSLSTLLQLCSCGKSSWARQKFGWTHRYVSRPLPSCGSHCESLAQLLQHLTVLWGCQVSRSGAYYFRAAPEFLASHTRQSLEFGTLSWFDKIPKGGSMDAMFLPKPPCKVVSFQSYGTCPGLPCMR